MVDDPQWRKFPVFRAFFLQWRRARGGAEPGAYRKRFSRDWEELLRDAGLLSAIDRREAVRDVRLLESAGLLDLHVRSQRPEEILSVRLPLEAEPRLRALFAEELPRKAPAFDFASVDWAPELAFLRTGDVLVAPEDLLKLHAFFQEGSGAAEMNIKERSLQIFGDEKRLDALRTTSLFREDRLSLAALRCHTVPEPLGWQRGPSRTGYVLVVENACTWETYARWNAGAGRYSAVVYGGGNRFLESVVRLRDLFEEIGVGPACSTSAISTHRACAFHTPPRRRPSAMACHASSPISGATGTSSNVAARIRQATRATQPMLSWPGSESCANRPPTCSNPVRASRRKACMHHGCSHSVDATILMRKQRSSASTTAGFLIRGEPTCMKKKSSPQAANLNLPVSKQTAGGVTGAIVGGAIAGPVGAVVGAVAGTMMGNRAAKGKTLVSSGVSAKAKGVVDAAKAKLPGAKRAVSKAVAKPAAKPAAKKSAAASSASKKASSAKPAPKSASNGKASATKAKASAGKAKSASAGKAKTASKPAKAQPKSVAKASGKSPAKNSKK